MNKAANVGAGIVNSIGGAISFANDLMDDAKGFAGELAVKGAAGLGRGLANTIDIAGDGAALLTDAISGGVATMTGHPEDATNYSGKEGIIDKVNKHVQGGFDQIEDATKSKLGKTFVGEKISDGVGFVGEMVSPMGIVGKAGKGAKIAKEYVQTVKNSPKALAELKALVIKAKNEGREVIQSEVDDVLKKYGKVGENVANEAKDKFHYANGVEPGFVMTEGMSQKTVDEFLKHTSKDDLLKALDKRTDDMYGATVGDVSELSRIDEFGNPYGDYKAYENILQETNRIRDMVNKSATIGGKTLDDKTLRFVEKVANYTPEQLASKSPKIAAMIKTGKFAGKVGVADILREMSQPEIDVIEEEINGKKVSEEPAKEVSNDGITFPDMPTSKDFNPSEGSKFNKVEDTQTVSDKKKELELLKEKNAGTLNASSSVVDLMKMLGANSTMEARKMLFEGLTSKPYEGTAEQNIQLKALVEEMFANGTLSDKIKSFKR